MTSSRSTEVQFSAPRNVENLCIQAVSSMLRKTVDLRPIYAHQDGQRPPLLYFWCRKVREVYWRQKNENFKKIQWRGAITYLSRVGAVL